MPYSNRRRTPYADIIKAEAPLARSAYLNKLSRDQERKQTLARLGLEQQSLTQSQSQYDEQLAEQERQFEEGLLESKRQFGLGSELQRQQAEQQAAQAQQATGLATAGLALEAYPYVKPALSSLGNVLFAEAPAAQSGAAAASSTGSLSIPTGTLSSGSGFGNILGSTAGRLGTIGAIAALQHGATNATDTTYKGQKTGDFFTFDEQGRWAPRFGNEPWHGWANSRLGLAPSAGEKFDAAMYNNDWNEALRVAPSTVQQWLNPVGDFGYDVVEGKWGPDVAGSLDPFTYGLDRLGSAKDLGDFGHGLVDTAAKFTDPIGTAIGAPVKDFVSDITGSTALGEVANVLVNPFGAVADFIENWF